MQTMEIGGRTSPIVGSLFREATGDTVPQVDIPMMSDYKWQLKALQGFFLLVCCITQYIALLLVVTIWRWLVTTV